MMMLTLVLCAWMPQQTSKTDRETLIRDARMVLSAIVDSARANQQKVSGDALTARYVQAAATAARQLPKERASQAFCLALGVALDTSSLMRGNPVVALTWRRIESNDEQRVRLAVLGKPTLYDRHDLAQHFSVSMALTVLLGTSQAESAGMLKEVLDANGGSGFSFADVAANLSGIEFAGRLLDQPERLAQVAKEFETSRFVLSPRGLTEGLTLAEFEKRYGSVRDPRFREARDDLVTRIKKLRGFREE